MPKKKNQFSWFHFNPSVPFLLINFPVLKVPIELQYPAEISCQVRTAQVVGAVLGPQPLPHGYSPGLQQDHPTAQALPVGGAAGPLQIQFSLHSAIVLAWGPYEGLTDGPVETLCPAPP